ncbi:MAG: hypothetical protein ACTHU0_19880 [Kofleriaceae bacterium]
MLFPAPTLQRIQRGEVTVAFRRWQKPTVRAGGTLRTSVGVLAIESVDEIAPASITTRDVRAAGYPDREALLAALRPTGRLYRIAFHLAGEDPRLALREQPLDAAARAAVVTRLAAIDARSPDGPWTGRVLALIARRPGVRAGDLATQVGMERIAFKQRVRKLKELGLTESLEVGYRLSPRGRSALSAVEIVDR